MNLTKEQEQIRKLKQAIRNLIPWANKGIQLADPIATVCISAGRRAVNAGWNLLEDKPERRNCGSKKKSIVRRRKKKIRLVITSDHNAMQVDVVFTKDRKAPADKWCATSGHKVDLDKVIEAILPDGFPLEQRLRELVSNY